MDYKSDRDDKGTDDPVKRKDEIITGNYINFHVQQRRARNENKIDTRSR